MNRSMLSETLGHLCGRSAAAVVARGRLASHPLNSVLLRRLSAVPGKEGSLLSAPVFEAARVWEQAGCTLGQLAGQLLHPRLVDALDGAAAERMPRDRRPYVHQLAAWEVAAEGYSCLVTSGTGSGKTECFMIPMLDDLVRDAAKGRLSGVRAIVIYPLNALIESQRERLNAWTEGLKDRITYALYNGLTPEKPRDVKQILGGAELGDRKSIRENPPSILITNVTMLEYLLLRAKDQPILERSQGLLRWIVLDEAHGYIGAQAAEMALLLRRVRAAFGVEPDQVRVMATSATISEGDRKETQDKLKRFVADLAGASEERVRVIEGHEAEPELPPPNAETVIDPTALSGLSSKELWERLAPHPRLRRLRLEMKSHGLHLSKISEILFDSEECQDKAQTVLDAAAQAQDPKTARLLLPWRVHLFHRAQGGFWVCIDANCSHRDPELANHDAAWGFGAVWLAQRDHCECGAPVFELLACTECGTPHLVAGRESGAIARLIPHRGAQTDEFIVDEEPDPDAEAGPVARDTVWLRPAHKAASDRHVCLESGKLYDNGAPEGARAIAIDVIEFAEDRSCCAGASKARLQPQRYGAPFFMGNALPEILERLSPPLDKPGLPMGGRRAITFSDSRQGVARLAAKLQQDAERTLTRSFLYHAVQEDQGLSGEERSKLERKLKLYQEDDPAGWADEIAEIKKQLSGTVKPLPWSALISRFGEHDELKEFATKVWAERDWGGREMAENSAKLAEMFLYRELFRRPRVQNNAETMGLVRLMFPDLETKARRGVPRVLQQVGVDADGWAGLAQAAVDAVFRDSLAIDIRDWWMVRWVSPRWGKMQAVCRAGLAPQDVPAGSRPWPGARLNPSNPSRLVLLIYRLIQGNPDDPLDQDRAREVLDALWSLITTTAARDSGRGAWRLDFSKAAVARVDRGWLCPITRRIFGYTTGGPSPFGPVDERLLAPVDFPRLPLANAGGLGREEREEVERWCRENAGVADLRTVGLWTDLHDRIAIYPPFLRAQEHSAQIERPVLQRYEERFKEGQINLLNCSTTMEMGVDIPNVALVANSNVPPSVSNYRQRVGRAGRRGEAWAFAMTFCRDLPLDHVVFVDPLKFLTARITAPAVRLDSIPVVIRHVHAALLGGFLRAQANGLDIKTSIGAFFGSTQDGDAPVTPENNADTFVICLRDPNFIETQREHLGRLVRGTALERNDAAYLCAETAEAFEQLLRRWRNEYEKLLERAASATEADVRQAFENRARRMHGEFLLSELARRGFTPSYGFPVDVVSFDHLSGHRRETHEEKIAFGEYRGGASRTLNVAIREYAPGAEVVIDGLVHESEGLLPAWSAMADASRLEDLQIFWECRSCHEFGVVRTLQDVPENCPCCNTPQPDRHNTLRPAGFLGRRAPHTGYESLGHVPFEMPRLAARTPWQALPDATGGRMRADNMGHVVTQSSGPHGMGYALCLCCGRAEAETDELRSPDMLKDHKPLAPMRQEQLVKGACPGGLTQRARIQRNLRLIHEAHTDVFELQLPLGVTRGQALALAAGLREALAERLGAEAREIGLATGRSVDPAGASSLSAFLYDKAAGGAGLVTRLAEFDWFKACLERAIDWLSCSEKCDHGCPSCILRPDMNFGEDFPDRPGAQALAQDIFARLKLPAELQVFGEGTQLVGQPATEFLERQRLSGKLRSLTFYLHAAPVEWELAAWPIAEFLKRAAETGVRATLVIGARALTDKSLEMAQKLDLHRICGQARLAIMSALPMVKAAPLLTIAETDRETIGIAAADPADATPGPNWGLGQTGPLILGMMAAPAEMQPIEPDRLVELSSGNARLIRLRDELDGPAAGFGARFWQTMETADPLAVAALRQIGVSEAIYTDRYLLTPLNFRLLHEVLATLPGKDAGMRIEIATAQLGRSERAGYQAYHPYVDDRERQSVLERLFPGAKVSVLPKAQQPHARSLKLKLSDGRRLQILFDQGFGAWRTSGSARHDFLASPDRQAADIKKSDIRVHVAEKDGAPVIIEFL